MWVTRRPSHEFGSIFTKFVRWVAGHGTHRMKIRCDGHHIAIICLSHQDIMVPKLSYRTKSTINTPPPTHNKHLLTIGYTKTKDKQSKKHFIKYLMCNSSTKSNSFQLAYKRFWALFQFVRIVLDWC